MRRSALLTGFLSLLSNSDFISEIYQAATLATQAQTHLLSVNSFLPFMSTSYYYFVEKKKKNQQKLNEAGCHTGASLFSETEIKHEVFNKALRE